MNGTRRLPQVRPPEVFSHSEGVVNFKCRGLRPPLPVVNLFSKFFFLSPTSKRRQPSPNSPSDSDSISKRSKHSPAEERRRLGTNLTCNCAVLAHEGTQGRTNTNCVILLIFCAGTTGSTADSYRQYPARLPYGRNFGVIVDTSSSMEIIKDLRPMTC